jgi:hypothetical protein
MDSVPFCKSSWCLLNGVIYQDVSSLVKSYRSFLCCSRESHAAALMYV